MTEFKATPDQWAYQEHWAKEDGDAACILELRNRVEALELGAGIRSAVAREVRRSFPVGPERSLVERVAAAIGRDGEPINWEPEAHASIREVAAWLDTRGQHGCSLWLREELEADS